MFKSFNRVRGWDFPPLKLKVSSPVSLNHVSTAAFVPFMSCVVVYIKSLIHLISRIYGTNFQLVPPVTVLGLLFLLWDLLKLSENGCSSIQAVCHRVEQHKQAFIHTKKCFSMGNRHRASGKRGCLVLTHHINKVGRRLITRASICQTGRQAVRLLSPPWTLRLLWFSPAAGHEYWPMHPRLKRNICFSAG